MNPIWCTIAFRMFAQDYQFRNGFHGQEASDLSVR